MVAPADTRDGRRPAGQDRRGRTESEADLGRGRRSRRPRRGLRGTGRRVARSTSTYSGRCAVFHFSRARWWKKEAKTPATEVTTTIAQTSRKTSSSLPPVVSGVESEEDTV